MRNLLVPVAVAASLMLGSSAFAATTTAPAAPAPAKSAPAAHANKREACEASWKTQKTHTGSRAAYMKACVAKG
ncbi:hypothetical protein [Phenylobacterium sp. SCN 70-31]|uniref:hypothetical protein n=1 Tax=Phenylobacterium sp. SCN 70-31 TaxID=1660129 RepID=UPI00086ED71C|nr:hypothetical protein [Phenylobacterium sp. SCN 70-31]ODT88340.1 MAG: hypothetical protein ABS78_06885 [Phenylobacterium sp. SCN 70-31]